jgi:hypothetical protein
VDPRAGLDDMEKYKFLTLPDSNFGRSCQLLHRLGYRSSHIVSGIQLNESCEDEQDMEIGLLLRFKSNRQRWLSETAALRCTVYVSVVLTSSAAILRRVSVSRASFTAKA